MQVERKHEQWKAITESDFVTLFIKTWFTFIAVLRELNPDVDVFTEDGMPRGDKPFRVLSIRNKKIVSCF